MNSMNIILKFHPIIIFYNLMHIFLRKSGKFDAQNKTNSLIYYLLHITAYCVYILVPDKMPTKMNHTTYSNRKQQLILCMLGRGELCEKYQLGFNYSVWTKNIFCVLNRTLPSPPINIRRCVFSVTCMYCAVIECNKIYYIESPCHWFF